ncbi:uncharacterized protein [Watersipora subatra]|uniref:uncharacterized protein n=1 Tax=Watersipora subatra TaxID=2589382 RepID=UPI00355C2B0C
MPIQIFKFLLLAALFTLSLAQQHRSNSAPRVNPSWFIEQPDPYEAPERPDVYEAPEIPDALLLSAVRNEPGAHQAVDNYRRAHRAAYDEEVNNYRQHISRPSQGRIGSAPVSPGHTASASARARPVPARASSHRAQVPLHSFIEQPDPFEAPERPDAYEAPEIPDALLLSAVRNDPGAHQAIDNYRRAHRAAYDAKVNSYHQQFQPQANTQTRSSPARQQLAPRRQLAPKKQPTPARRYPAPVPQTSVRRY